jgi:hypothetical protein
VLIAGVKGLIAGLVNLGLTQAIGIPLPGVWSCVLAGAVGLLGYGVSLVLFVYALRHVGAARTGAYFSSAAFVGAIIALALLREAPNAFFWVAAVLMGTGVWLHSPSTTRTSMIMMGLRIPTATCTMNITYTNTILTGTGRSLTRISTYTSHCYTAIRAIQTFTTGIVTRLRFSCDSVR